MTLAPRIQGTLPIQSPGDRFIEGLRARVSAGLLSGRPHRRSNYRIVDGGRDQLRIRADDWLTAFNVGLNEMNVRVTRPGFVDYRVTYWRWSAYALALCGVLGVIGLGLLLGFDMRGYIAREPSARAGGLSVNEALAIVWGMVIFWGFVWPWILITMHKGPLRGLVSRIVAEVDLQQSAQR